MLKKKKKESVCLWLAKNKNELNIPYRPVGNCGMGHVTCKGEVRTLGRGAALMKAFITPLP